ncbi:MAG TPA: hypothetical protein VNE00_06315, partial [Paraburkholderia sp.]|nr:hypothetical protein [Paraburkholderia sp.]
MNTQGISAGSAPASGTPIPRVFPQLTHLASPRRLHLIKCDHRSHISDKYRAEAEVATRVATKELPPMELVARDTMANRVYAQ